MNDKLVINDTIYRLIVEMDISNTQYKMSIWHNQCDRIEQLWAKITLMNQLLSDQIKISAINERSKKIIVAVRDNQNNLYINGEAEEIINSINVLKKCLLNNQSML